MNGAGFVFVTFFFPVVRPGGGAELMWLYYEQFLSGPAAAQRAQKTMP